MRIQIEPYESNLFVFNIFYNLFSTLNILRDDPFYGRSVVFESFMLEHKIRIGLSVIISIANIGLVFHKDNKSLLDITITLFVFYIILLFINIKLLKSKIIPV